MPGKPPLSELLGDVHQGQPIRASEENVLRQIATQNVDLPDAIQDSSGVRQARTRKRGGSGTGFIKFEIVAVGPYWGEDLGVACDYVVGKVLRVSCGLTGVSVDEEVNIWDFDQCWTDLPIEILVGMKGTAVEMRNDMEDVTDCRDDRAAEGACLWEVEHLCCGEEINGDY